MTDSNAVPFVRYCHNHQDVVAEARCVVCGKPVCRDCARMLPAGPVCAAADHREIAELWTAVHRSVSEFDADLISKNLSLQGIETKVFSSRVYSQTIRELPDDLVQVFIRKEFLGRAREILHSLRLAVSED